MKGISIIIPCFNRENTIKCAIESIINQNYYGNYEIIVSDDGSTDNSIEIANSLGEKVVVLKKPINCKDQGASGARNRGIKVAKFDYICFLDSDDYYLPNYLNTVSKFLDNYKDIGYIFCRCKQEILSDKGVLIIKDWTRKQLNYLDKKYHVLYRSLNINTNVVIIRKNVIEQVGFFNTNLIIGEDSDMWIRISEISNGMFLNIYGATYRINHSSHQLTQNTKKIKRSCSIEIYLNALKRYLESRDNDKLRFLLILRMIIYLKMNDRKGFLFSVYRYCISSFLLFILFPFTFFVYLIYGSIR